MADHLSEEEQIEALKRWWKEYWKSIVVPVVLVAAGYYGWNIWQEQKREKAEAGAVKYDQLVKAMEAGPGDELDDQQKAVAKLLANEIVEGFEGSLYADHANLALARLAVDEKDFDAAEAYLQRVVDIGANNSIQSLATARLARVKVAKSDFEGALSLVTSTGDSAFKALYAEVRGDALAGQGKSEAARTAYQEAIDALPANQFNRRSILQIKFDGAEILAKNREEATSESAHELDAPEEENDRGETGTDAENS